MTRIIQDDVPMFSFDFSYKLKYFIDTVDQDRGNLPSKLSRYVLNIREYKGINKWTKYLYKRNSGFVKREKLDLFHFTNKIINWKGVFYNLTSIIS